MSLTTIAIGGTDYPSYATVAEADAYLGVDPLRRAAWSGLRPQRDKGVNLIAATRRLDSLNWAGSKAAASQATEWPRQGLFYETGDAVPGDAIPERLEQACILMAGGLVAGLIDAYGDGSEAAIQSERIGPFATTYFHPRRRSYAARLLGDALGLVRQWLSGALVSAPVATGTGERSEFYPPGRYGRTEGMS